MFEWYKKEKPFLGIAGFGGGVSSQLLRAALADSQYEIERSIRLNSADSPYLSKSFVNTETQTYTLSCWVKRSKIGTNQRIYSTNANSYIMFDSSDNLHGNLRGTTGTNSFWYTNAVFRDVGAWYHIVMVWDTSNATQADRIKLYVNGVEQTFTSTSFPNYNQHSGGTHTIGGPSYYTDLYLADVHYIGGQALDPTSFGEFDPDTGIWDPIAYTGSYGTNGFHLPFSDNSTAAALGTDTSGNSNTWTVNNISVASGAGNDSLRDSPTNGDTADDTGLGGQVPGNYATLNPLNIHSAANDTISNGNLNCSMVGGSAGLAPSTIGFSSGKFYYEVVWSDNAAYGIIGIRRSDSRNYDNTYLYEGTGTKYTNGGSGASYGSSFVNGDVISCAVDMDAGTLTFYKNGTSQGQAFTGISGTYTFIQGMFNGTTGAYSVNFGQRAFAYSVPSGFKPLATLFLTTPTIVDGSKYVGIATYTGTGATQTISGLGFSPDLIWIKSRSNATWHNLTDIVRGSNKSLFSNSTNIETTETDIITSINSDGFTLGADANSDGTNINNHTYAAWTWEAGGEPTTDNVAGAGNVPTAGSVKIDGANMTTTLAGSIPATRLSASTTAGFSVVSYTTDNSSTNQTIGHGLGVQPKLIIIKARDQAYNWDIYHGAISNAKDGRLIFTTAAFTTASAPFGGVDPTSSVFTMRQVDYGNNVDCVAYCFAPVKGYSAFGSYTGNLNADGPFVFCDFRPRFLLLKSAGSGDWVILDTARDTYNIMDSALYPNDPSGDFSSNPRLDILSNGFKLRSTYTSTNPSSTQVVYAAFAENPFALNARAR